MLYESSAEAYRKALKQGRRTLRSCLRQGVDPYPRVMEEAYDGTAAVHSVDLGHYEVPLSLVVGTKTRGRQNAVARDFMPLLKPGTEFAAKWTVLHAQLAQEGLRDAIECCEYLGMLYVVEGNKRVSVMAYNDAPALPVHVTRVTLSGAIDPWYQEFLETFERTGLFEVRFFIPGQFPKLQAALGVDADHVWTDEQRRRFAAGYARFSRVFDRTAPKDARRLSALDALIVWLRYFPFSQLRTMSDAELQKSIKLVRGDLSHTGEKAQSLGGGADRTDGSDRP